jgi:general secretion pathway protein E
VVSEPLRDLVNERPQIEALRRQAVADGMQPLRLAGALRVAEGRTVLDEVLIATPEMGTTSA